LKRICHITLVLITACSGRQEINKEPVTNTPYPSIPSITIHNNDSLLSKQNGIVFYQTTPFSGIVESYDDQGRLRVRQSFYKGKEEGFLRSYYADGQPDAERFYRGGEKDSVNRGWWPNGKLRFEYHFDMGVYEGDFKEWYHSGRPYKHIYYHQGKEQWGRGWRENGKPYMSFETRNGRVYGSINPNLCYSLKNERGEYIAARK
jgi:antitoxin component YwqK of YwqJK toxin-antitoxin module